MFKIGEEIGEMFTCRQLFLLLYCVFNLGSTVSVFIREISFANTICHSPVHINKILIFKSHFKVIYFSSKFEILAFSREGEITAE